MKSGQAPALLKRLFTSDARARILRLLLMNPKERFYQRDIAERCALPLLSVQREMKNLAELRLVLEERDGNRIYYPLNPTFPILEELTRIVLKTCGVAQVLREHFGPEPQGIRAAFIFGSYAKGEPETWSDVDLMVVGAVRDLELTNAIAPAEEESERVINHLLYSPEEFARKIREDNNFLLTVLAEPKIFIMGGEDDLKRLARKEAPPGAQDERPGDRPGSRGRRAVDEGR